LKFDAERAALTNRVVDQMAMERGIDPSQGIPPDVRSVLVYEAERAYEDSFERIEDGELATPATPVEYFLAEVYALDDQLHDLMEGGRGPSNTLQ
jgi:hypothetical protein